MGDALRGQPEEQLHALVAAALLVPRDEPIALQDRIVELLHRRAVMTTYDIRRVPQSRPELSLEVNGLEPQKVRVAGHAAFVELGARAQYEFSISLTLPDWLTDAMGPMPARAHPQLDWWLDCARRALWVTRGLNIVDVTSAWELRSPHHDPFGYAERAVFRWGLVLQETERRLGLDVEERPATLRLVKSPSERGGRDL